jgi:hypothetical protein
MAAPGRAASWSRRGEGSGGLLCGHGERWHECEREKGCAHYSVTPRVRSDVGLASGPGWDGADEIAVVELR